MKIIILVALIFTSCGINKSITCKQDSFVLIKWKKANSTFDVYLEDSLVVQNIPCDGTNNLYLHNYSEGEYLFIFKKDGRVNEKRIINISSQIDDETSSLHKR